MRRFDKYQNMIKKNILMEQRYLNEMCSLNQNDDLIYEDGSIPDLSPEEEQEFTNKLEQELNNLIKEDQEALNEGLITTSLVTSALLSGGKAIDLIITLSKKIFNAIKKVGKLFGLDLSKDSAENLIKKNENLGETIARWVFTACKFMVNIIINGIIAPLGNAMGAFEGKVSDDAIEDLTHLFMYTTLVVLFGVGTAQLLFAAHGISLSAYVVAVIELILIGTKGYEIIFYIMANYYTTFDNKYSRLMKEKNKSTSDLSHAMSECIEGEQGIRNIIKQVGGKSEELYKCIEQRITKSH